MPRKPKTAHTAKARPILTHNESQPTLTEPQAAAPKAPPSGRAASGRFAVGNRGGPGNPHARHCARMLELFRNSISDEEMHRLYRMLYTLAEAGDANATKLIFAYKIGKPLPAPNPDAIDRDEWEHYQQGAIESHEMKLVLNSLPASVGNDIARTALPIMTDARTRELAAQLHPGCTVSEEATTEIVDTDEEPQYEAPISNGDRNTDDRTQRGKNDNTPSTNASDRPVENAPLSNGKRNDANPIQRSTLHASRATTNASRTTRSHPLSNGKTKSAPKSKKQRKKAKALWLQPLARQLKQRAAGPKSSPRGKK